MGQESLTSVTFTGNSSHHLQLVDDHQRPSISSSSESATLGWGKERRPQGLWWELVPAGSDIHVTRYDMDRSLHWQRPSEDREVARFACDLTGVGNRTQHRLGRGRAHMPKESLQRHAGLLLEHFLLT